MTLQEQIDFILGPQVPVSTSWLDQTLINKARQHGAACPADPPTGDNELNSFVLLHYYDLSLSLYIAHRRTGDPAFLALARKAADSWWKMPGWIGEGKTRHFPDSATPSPRHAGIAGLILRALDGRPEMWDWMVEYTKANVGIWLTPHMNESEVYILREGAFTFHFAALLAATLPDSYPLQAGGTATNGAQIRARFLADVENVAVNYFGRLQKADGSWRWGNPVNEYGDTKFTLAAPAAAGSTTLSTVDPVPEAIPQGEFIWINGLEIILRVTNPVTAGSKSIPVQQKVWNDGLQSYEFVALKQELPKDTVGQYAPMVNMMQPFMIGLLLSALCDAYEVVTTPAAKESIKKQILTGCRFLYAGGPYTRLVVFGTPIRGFHYFFGGGTTVNPTKYANGDLTVASMTERGYIPNARQAISTILPPFGKAFQLSEDPFYKDAASEMYDSAYGGGDGYRSYIDGDAKSYNQHGRRVGSLAAWLGGAPSLPAPQPAPQPAPEPEPTPTTPTPEPAPTSPTTPSPDGTKGTIVVDSQGAVWTIGAQKQTLKNGSQMGGGQGTIYKIADKTVHVLGMDSNWYKWSGSSWSSVGPTEPGVVTQPTPVPEPAPSPTPSPTPTGPPIGDIQKGDWPTSEGGQEASTDAWWAKGYRLKTTKVRGAYALFEKVK